ncbi:hypothetical protein ACES2I_02455 [Bdellovibrio bacteriovorus]|uniref:hypothetical protein n=1 Tax=Bdellovibrio bacteriovorus TaxID=959 RepID=UPI0035A5E6C3
MGNWYFGCISLLFSALLLSAPASADTFLGCAEWCAARFLPKSGQADHSQMRKYDMCVVQTQNEGRCGGAPRSSGTSRPAQQRQQEPAQSSNYNPEPGSVPCGGRCPISECVDVNGSGRDYQCRIDIINGNAQSTVNDCTSQYTELLNECSNAVQETSHTCDEKNDSGMSGVANTASQLGLMLGQQTSGSIQSACSQMASFSAAANAAVAAYRLNCNSALGTCRSTCSRLVDFVQNNPTCTVQGFQGTAGSNAMLLQNAESKAERCDQFESKVQEATQAINNVAGTMRNAASCAAATSGESAPVPEICKTNPNLPGCVATGPVDCTKPELAGTKICVCSKNPTDPICMSENSNGGSTFLSSTNPGARLNTSGVELSGGDLPSLPGIEHGKRGPGGAGEAVDGKQGGGAGISSSGGGSGGGAAGAGEGGGAEGEEGGHSVNAGFYGGGGSFGGYGGGSGEGRAGQGQPGQAGVAGKNGAPDLRQFLPGGKYDPKARGVAGTGGPDGITGPHSNIWKKIQNRYQVLTPTLIP